MPAAQARCERALSEAGNIKVFTLRVQDANADFLRTLQPGRHVAIKYPDSSGIPRQRLYSITSKEAPHLFEIAVKRLGRGGVSDHLHSTLHEGSIVPLQYLAGDITVESIIDYERIGMIAGGIGITLPIALIRELSIRSRAAKQVPDVVLILCVPRIADIPFLHELLELNLTTNWFIFRVFITQERVRACDHFIPGRPTADSLSIMGQPQAVVICGSHAFAHAFREQAVAIFPSACLHIESFTSSASSAAPEKSQGENSSPLQLLISDSTEVIEAYPGKSLLEILESNGTPIRSQCRAGICGNCRVKVSEGECRFEPDFCLGDQDKLNGYALACCTFPLSGNIKVDLKPTE